MSQAEIAGGAVTPENELPSKGCRIRDFDLTSALGRTFQLSDYRGRANLVLIVDDGGPETAKLLSDAASHYSEIKNEEAEVLAILSTSQLAAEAKQRLRLPYPVVADEQGRIHRRLGAADARGHEYWAVYITDRFGEVFGLYRRSEGQPPPDIADILNWLEFVNSQCPECGPPEWPLD